MAPARKAKLTAELTCPRCRFSMKMPEHTLGERPICPVCSQAALEMTEEDQLRLSGGWRRKKTAPVVLVAPGVVRNLILGPLLLVLGPALVLWASSWPARAGYVKAVFIGHGVVLTGWGIVVLLLGLLRKTD